MKRLKVFGVTADDASRVEGGIATAMQQKLDEWFASNQMATVLEVHQSTISDHEATALFITIEYTVPKE